MKKLKGLDEKVESVSGPEDSVEMPTLKKLLQVVISNSKTRTADDARRIARVTPKIRSTPEAELSDEEFKTLKDLVEANQANLSGYAQGCVLLKLDEANA